MEYSKKPSVCWPGKFFFPPEKEAGWEKGHHRLERRRIARAPVSPEEIGLCGCWQVIAVQRERAALGANAAAPTLEVGYYATSLTHQQTTEQELLKIIRDHWAAIENGSHYRRDMSLGEDGCRVGKRAAAQILAALRNLTVGLYELQKERARTKTKELKAWCRRLTFSNALKLLST